MRPAFGQYVPVASPVHSLDARTKMLIALGFTVALFLLGSLVGLAVAAVAVIACIRVARVPYRVALRGVRAVAVILAVTLIAHALRWGPAPLPLLRIGQLTVDGRGLLEGVFFAGRIVLLVVGTSLVTLTTTPVDIADGLERLMSPLKIVRVPVEDLAMMLTIALRFIPTTATEAERVVLAQRARGARFDSGGPIRRTRAYVPVLVPLFVNLFRRAEELSTAMEARGYRGGPGGRTRLRESRMRTVDWVVIALSLAALATLATVL